MLYAVKGNTQLKIEEAERSDYLKLGYDIAEVDGEALKTVETSPSKSVSYAEHQKALDEIESLKAQLAGADTKAAGKSKAIKADGEPAVE
ncbi:hypothetical protein KIH86_13885 [Paenibacillus sp. HN-1]|uniref:hypothetical protein n=1 Tax=Paenibacillus TaxID=44249 RepID=UPI001CA8D455|nr:MULTISPECIES: hypothetical protein [Paenibacillus]MBY9082378.1 hypothetical protein [Paenibacillus sp. CGMCC 1.18879]MBY9085318.1 hypothetical protein [Paenibacillus sinensis]